MGTRVRSVMNTAAPPSRRRLRRGLVPLGLLALILGAGVFLWVRGTWADGEPRAPESAEDGPVCHLYQPHGGHKRIRCAQILPYPPDRIWELLTDYGRYDEFLPYLSEVQAEARVGGGCHMTGQARSALSGYWPFALDIVEEKDGEARRVSWDQTGTGTVLVNRGGWAVTPHGEDTLLVLELEAEVSGYPTFCLRNVFLYRLPQVLQAVRQRLAAGTEGADGN